MGKVLKESDFNEHILREKIKIYELENSQIQNILKRYWENAGKEKMEFSSIIEELDFIITAQSLQSVGMLSKLKNKLKGLKGK